MIQPKVLLLVAVSCLTLVCRAGRPDPVSNAVQLSSSGKPLVKRPAGTKYNTVIQLDGGSTRGIISVMVLLELEQSIKRYLLAHPQLLPTGFSIARLEDFDINLADYFDCISGISAGAWSSLYLASRGGQGTSRAVLDSSEIVEKYGVIPSGGVEGLRVLYKEFSSVIYPFDTINLSAGNPLDITNPMAAGVAEPLFSLDGLEQTLRAFLGETTLADCDTSVLVPALDLITSETILFVQNAFRTTPVTSSARMTARAGPRTIVDRSTRFTPDLNFEEGKDYLLADIGAGSGSPPGLHPAKNMTQVGSDEVDFILVDALGLLNTALTTAFFTASESPIFSLEHVAIIDIGAGNVIGDRSFLAEEGLGGWSNGLDFPFIILFNGQRSLLSLTDFAFYANPAVKPLQYLRIEVEVSADSEEASVLGASFIPALVDAQEQIGIALATEHRQSIDIFVEDFVFGQT